MRKPEIAQRVQDKYRAFINAIPLERFSDRYRSLEVTMEAKYFPVKGMSADGLLTKANDVLKNVRVMAAGIRGVGTPLHQIPSGRSLMDMRNEFILKKWNAMQGTIYAPSNNNDELMLDVQDGWWLINTTTKLLLAVLVHRCNPDVIADPTTVCTGPTREILRKDSQKDTVKKRERDCILEHHATGCQRVEESMLESKAQLMARLSTLVQSTKSRSSSRCCHSSRTLSSRFRIALTVREKMILIKPPMTFCRSCHS